MKLHSGKQYLILDENSVILDSATWSIYDHAYRLTTGKLVQSRKDDLLASIKAIMPKCHNLAECYISGIAIIKDALPIRPTRKGKPYSYAIADATRSQYDT